MDLRSTNFVRWLRESILRRVWQLGIRCIVDEEGNRGEPIPKSTRPGINNVIPLWLPSSENSEMVDFNWFELGFINYLFLIESWVKLNK
jgi:hypothetical protein